YVNFILECIYKNDYSYFDEFYAYAQKHEFHHVKCILNIIYFKAINRELPLYQLDKIINDYTNDLFISHSQNDVLEKIEYTIFADCKYQPRITQHFTNSKYPAYKPKLLPQSFCEGIEWYKDEPAEYVVIDGHKKIIKELDPSVDLSQLNRLTEMVSTRKVKCRRHGCNACTPDLLN